MVMVSSSLNMIQTCHNSISEYLFERVLFEKVLGFCWAIYFHRNEVKFNMVKPSPLQIVEIWKREISKITIFHHTTQDLQISLDNNHRQRINSHNSNKWQQGDILLVGKRFKQKMKNVFIAFCFSNNQLLFLSYFSEYWQDQLRRYFLQRLKEVPGIQQRSVNSEANLICRRKFSSRGKLQGTKQDM